LHGMQEVIGSTPIFSTKATHSGCLFCFMAYYTYILYSDKTDRYYVGSCHDMGIRLAQHNAGRNTSTKAGAPWQLRYSETYPTSQLARKREAEIKRKKSRRYNEQLISSAG
jgi:putative endonuclease